MTLFEKSKYIASIGYYIGLRDPNRNKAFVGKFMICEELDEGPSDDSSGGEWCIVGDDLEELVTLSYDAVEPF